MIVDINSLGSPVGMTGIGTATPYRATVAGEASGVQERARVAETAKTVNTVRTQALAQQQDEQTVQDGVDKLNEFIKPYVTSLQFSIDKDAGKVVVKILDTETQEVIKQFPSEQVLALAKALAEVLGKPEGLLVQQEA
ncbi:MAG: flagellar protein FlaG [Azoarcus sp.]|jgi:flagellar protein FlaG|nr:flagellar protein FlaG [Azoarcus sp.]